MQNHTFGSKSLLFAFLITVLMAPWLAFAQVQDSDADGLTDVAEQEIYHTDPTNADTDTDGISDATEILKGYDPLTKTTPSNQPADIPLAWYIGRASGILAFILLSIVVINGLLISTRLVFHFLPPALNYEMHRSLSWMALLTVIGHFVSFTFDSFFQLTFLEALIPFSVTRTFMSAVGANIGIAIGLGTLGFYIILTQIITSELKNKLIKHSTWRKLHYLSFIGYLLFLGHGIAAGTDTKTWWMIWLYTLSGSLVLLLIIIRIVGSVKQAKKKRLAQTPHQS